MAVTLFRNSNKKTYSFPFGPYDNLPATIQVQISRKGSVIISEIRECHFGSTELIIITVSLHDFLKLLYEFSQKSLVIIGLGI